jgi:hypothetical protein
VHQRRVGDDLQGGQQVMGAPFIIHLWIALEEDSVTRERERLNIMKGMLVLLQVCQDNTSDM